MPTLNTTGTRNLQDPVWLMSSSNELLYSLCVCLPATRLTKSKHLLQRGRIARSRHLFTLLWNLSAVGSSFLSSVAFICRSMSINDRLQQQMFQGWMNIVMVRSVSSSFCKRCEMRCYTSDFLTVRSRLRPATNIAPYKSPVLS